MARETARQIETWAAEGRTERLVGTLYAARRGRAEYSTLIYDTGYLAAPGSYALDPSLPLVAGPHQTAVGQALFGALSDCSPDRWGRTLVKRQEAAAAKAEARPARQLGELDFLLGVRDDLRQGALRFRQDDGPFIAQEGTGVPGLTDLPELLDLAARADDDATSLPDLRRLIRAGSSLGGARPKAHVRNQDGRIAIAKFPSASTDTWNVMAWEKVALDLAAMAGVDVPPSDLLNLAGRSVLVLDRFDRADDGGRIGYASAMTMLEAKDGDQRSYLEIAEVIENQSRRATAELRQLWRRLIFSILISNTDDHLRNHGFLHEHDDVWRLAPAFDLNPDPVPGPKHLSTAIEDDDAASLEAALEVAGYFRLTVDQARTCVAEMRKAVAQWPRVAHQHGLGKSACTAMAHAFEAHQESS